MGPAGSVRNSKRRGRAIPAPVGRVAILAGVEISAAPSKVADHTPISPLSSRSRFPVWTAVPSGLRP